MSKITQKNFYERVLSGEERVEKVYDSQNVLAFYYNKIDSKKTHIILLPKVFISDFIHIKEEHKEVIWEILSVARYLAKAVESKKSGVKLYTEGGVFQEYPYLHFHLISDRSWE